MNINVNKEMLIGLGNAGLKLGKAIVIEGTKAVILNAAATTIKTSFDEGFDGVKDLTFDDLLEGKDKKKRAKKKLFAKARNSKGKVEEEIEVEIVEEKKVK